ncbi:MAG: response regulator [Anaerolineae bacterium]|nr:response regulator [Anaerolineae bacterium]
MSNQPVVLYVEDDIQSRRMMDMLLKGRMKLSSVTILEDSEQFIDRMNALNPKPDIIFLDIHMKPYNGFEMLTMLREFEWAQNIPIVALTASVMNEEVHQLRQAGFDGCLGKPIDIVTFPDMFNRILDGESIWRILS